MKIKTKSNLLIVLTLTFAFGFQFIFFNGINRLTFLSVENENVSEDSKNDFPLIASVVPPPKESFFTDFKAKFTPESDGLNDN